jgi:hypothetical protein
VSCFQSAQKGTKAPAMKGMTHLVIFLENVPIIIEHVTLNKFNLLQKIILENKLTVQLFKKRIKTESIYKSNYDANLEGLVGERPNGLIKRERKRKHFKRKWRWSGFSPKRVFTEAGFHRIHIGVGFHRMPLRGGLSPNIFKYK